MKTRLWWDGCLGDGTKGEPCIAGTRGCTSGHGDHPNAMVKVVIEFGPSDNEEDLEGAVDEVYRAYARAVRRR